MIKTEIWAEKPDDPGMLKYQEQGKLSDIERQIKLALDKIIIDDRTALQSLYWITKGCPSMERWPRHTTPMISVRQGNESHLIEVLARNNRDPNAKVIFVLKIEWTNQPEAFAIAQQLDTFFE